APLAPRPSIRSARCDAGDRGPGEASHGGRGRLLRRQPGGEPGQGGPRGEPGGVLAEEPAKRQPGAKESTRRSGEDGDSPESPVAELADKLERLEARLDRLVGSVELLNQRLERQAAPPEVAETLARRSVEEVNLKMRLEALELQLCRDLVLQNSALELCQAQLTELRELARPREVDGARPPAAPDAAIAEAVAPLVAREVRRAVRAEYGRLVLGLADTSALPSGAELRSPSARSNLVAPSTSEDFAEAAPS
ncbi:unnamed protein product, partial [Effrenium voratum]